MIDTQICLSLFYSTTVFLSLHASLMYLFTIIHNLRPSQSASITLNGRCCSYSLCSDLFLLSELALLETHQDVLVASARHYVVSHDHLRVLLGPHTQVHEIGVALVQLLQGRLGLHNEVGDQGGVLHGRNLVLGEGLHWDA